jgi:hypothetical protein
MTGKKCYLLLLVLILLVLMLPACGGVGGKQTAAATTSAEISFTDLETQIYSNGNDGSVYNNPTNPTVFTLNNTCKVTAIMDYHYNYGGGASAGTIGLKDSTGKSVGTWTVTVRSDVYWDVKPNVVIGPGTYTVVDSDTSTWSQNNESNNQGMSIISGIWATRTTPIASASSTPAVSIPVRVGDIKTGSKVQVATQSLDSSGGIVAVSKPGDPLDGFVIDVPSTAYSGNATFKVSSAPITSQTFGSDITPISPMIYVDNGGAFANDLMYVRVPVKVPDGYFAMGFYYDPATKQLEGMPLLSTDADSVTVGAQHFSDFFISMISEELLSSDIDSGFRPGVDDWQFTNRGSYIAQGGHCEGQSLTALWYYCTKPDGAYSLYGRYDNNGEQPATPSLWKDDSFGYRFCSVVQKDIDNNNFANTMWVNMGGKAVKQDQNGKRYLADVPGIGDEGTWNLFAYSILATNEPQLVIIRSNAGGGHAMVCYRIKDGNLYIADPNYPGNTERRIEFTDSKFTPYNSGANADDIAAGKGQAYQSIFYYAKTTVISWATINQCWTELKAGTIGNDKFPAYQIKYKDSKGQYQLLTDGYMSDSKYLFIALKTDNDDLDFDVFLNGVKLNGISTSPNTFELQPGTNKLGIYINGSVPKTDSNGNPYSAKMYVDFKYITVYNSEKATTTTSGNLALLQKDTQLFLTFNGLGNWSTGSVGAVGVNTGFDNLTWNGTSFSAQTGTTLENGIYKLTGSVSPDGSKIVSMDCTYNMKTADGYQQVDGEYKFANIPITGTSAEDFDAYFEGDGTTARQYVSGATDTVHLYGVDKTLKSLNWDTPTGVSLSIKVPHK